MYGAGLCYPLGAPWCGCGENSAREIPEYFIPDFSDWKNHDEYQKASFGFAQDKFWAVDEGLKTGKGN